MFSVKQIEGAIPTVELVDGGSASRAVLAPARGGILTELALGGRELLYLDRATFEDRSANVRGGNPVLFPSPASSPATPGPPPAQRGRCGSTASPAPCRGRSTTMAPSKSGGAYARLVLRSSEATRAQYPGISAPSSPTRCSAGRSASICASPTRPAQAPRRCPSAPGFTPTSPSPRRTRPGASIETRATRAFDNTTKREAPFSGFDLTRPEVDLHLLDHGSTESSLSIEGTPGVRIAVRGSPEFTHWVVWTLQGKDFVCLEPWTCPGDALNTGERLIHLRSHETRALWIELSA